MAAPVDTATCPRPGGFALEEFGTVEEALSHYLEELLTMHRSKTLHTAAGAILMTKIGILKARASDVENGLFLLQESQRVLKSLDQAETEEGRHVAQCITFLEMFVIFRNHDGTGDGVFDKQVLQRITGWSEAELKRVLEASGCQVDKDLLRYDTLLRYLSHDKVPDLWESSSSQGSSSPQEKAIIGSQSADISATPAETFKTLVWNITSPEYASNALEYLPRLGVLSPTSRETLGAVLELARQQMLCSSTSKQLGEMVREETLLAGMGDLEKGPLGPLEEKQQQGLLKWFRSRSLAAEDKLDEAASRWLADPMERWRYWKEQTVNSWMRDDNSGGQVNPLLLSEEPSIDDTCWDLGISSADRACSALPRRLERARWLSRVEEEGSTFKEPKAGKYDYFKLLVWDLLVQEVLRQAEAVMVEKKGAVPSGSPSYVDFLLQELRPQSRAQKLASVRQFVSKVDLALLIEVPGEELNELAEEGFWVVRAQPADRIMNTIVVARKELFPEKPSATEFHREDGTVNPRAIECRLKSKNGRDLHVLAVHLAGKGYDWKLMANVLEERIGENTILAGDFNTDVRKSKLPAGVDPATTPKLCALLAQARTLPRNVASCCKQRLPFQAQVSKAFSQDFTMKDFVLLGDAFLPTELSGLVSREQRLPSPEVPSDHAALTFTVNFKA